MLEHNENSNHLAALLFKASHLIRERTPINERTNPTTFAQLLALQFVAASKEKRPTMQMIAKYLNITPPSATSLIHNLTSAKKLKRIFDKHDKRIVRLEITPLGKKTLANGRAHLTKRLGNILSILNGKEQHSLKDILNKITKHYVANNT